MNIIKRRSDFLKVSQSGYKWVTPAFILQLDRDPSLFKTEIGFTASKKVGGAVERNRAKRRMRALARAFLASDTYPPSRYVMVARDTLIKAAFTDLEKDLGWALKRVQNQWESDHV